MSDTDQDLLQAVRGGDRRALERLLARHQSQIYRFGAKMCRDEEDAKDVLQETMIAAARTIPEFRGTSAVSTWLYAIARSFCIKKRRTSKFAPERIDSLEAHAEQAAEIADPRRTPEEDVAGRQLQRALESAIGELDPMYREVLALRDVEGLSAAEVAEVMGLSVEAVKSRLHRARTAVREKIAPLLGPAGEGVPAPGPGCQDVVELFSRRLEGEIDAGACAELEQHLKTCAACRGRCESLRSTLALCKQAGAATAVPAHVERSVREALRRFLDAQP
ncbi:MAG TPA: sigma-70 family RNA polymerase sigma factor [Anaeromyxobacter sp.]|nr:sigma-70 family RNA polymerase sigma factor [Anaeromyxobacter sp.]